MSNTPTKEEILEIVGVATTIVESLQAAGIHPNIGIQAMMFIVNQAQEAVKKRAN